MTGPAVPLWVEVLALAVMVAVAVPVAWSLYRGGALRRDGGDGWASPVDLAPLTVRAPIPGRITLGTTGGRLLAAEPSTSLLVLGPTQSGKTTRLAAPALREWPGPVVATSVKRDLAELTSWARPHPVYIFDPTSPSSARWSPLDGCGDWRQALRMASWLVEAGKASDLADFWYAAATKLLAPMLVAAARGAHSMGTVVEWLDRRSWATVGQLLVDADTPAPGHAWTASITREARQLSSIVTTAETLLAAFADPMVADATAASDFTPAGLLDGPGTLYLVAPAHEQARLRPLFVALVRTVVAYAVEHAPTGLLLVLDEAANVAPLGDLDQLASTAAGLGIHLVTVFQDVAQLEHRYGHDRARTIVSNHSALLALAGLKDLSTLRLLSELVGDHDTPRTSRTTASDGRSSAATSTERRPIAPADTLRRMPKGTALLLYGNARPARLTLP